MGGVQAFFTRQIGPFPVYVYAGGLVALVGGYIYFKRHGTAAAASVTMPQTNPIPGADNSAPVGGGTNSVPGAPPLPYPDGSTPPVPPTPPFTTPAQTPAPAPVPLTPWKVETQPIHLGFGFNNPPAALTTPTDNLTSPPAVATPSQVFASHVTTERVLGAPDPAGTQPVPPVSAPPPPIKVLGAFTNIPIIGPIITRLIAPPPLAPAPFVAAPVGTSAAAGNRKYL